MWTLPPLSQYSIQTEADSGGQKLDGRCEAGKTKKDAEENIGNEEVMERLG